VEFWTSAAFRRFTQEDYFGIGPSTDQADRANYALHSLDVSGQAIFKATRWLQIGSDVGYYMPTIRSGTDPKWPSIEHQFTDASAPGLFEQPDFLHYGLFTAVDYRDARGNPHRGGYYRATLAQWDDRSFNRYDFRRFDGEVNQYWPLGGPRHVVVARGGVSYVNNARGARVPFYVFPYVGGANTIRSFAEFRFRDENALFLSGEYRVGVQKYVQLVGFVDAGKVAHDWQDLNLRNVKKGYGVGVRAGLPSRTFIRVDVGTGGGEGTRLFVKFFPTF
jgi:outer membrane protein assembly factor BamA